MNRSKTSPIVIVGAGAVGTALAVALHQRHFPLSLIISRRIGPARKLALQVGAKYGLRTMLRRVPKGSIIFLAVPDDEIARLASSFSSLDLDLSGSVVFHCSGALTAGVLKPLRRKGASTGSFHPLQTFAGIGRGIGSLEGIWVGLEGDAHAVATGERIARGLGARSFTLAPGQKSLYHVAAVFSSNYVVTLLSVVEELGKRIGLRRKRLVSIFEPILLQTLMNVRVHPAARALTGPIARGDLRTIRRHRRALRSAGLSGIDRLYAVLAGETSQLAKKRGR
ncbi:MAG TPA: DUF2520 domain-containing protein [Bacteroidota bacterium]|nr:DUF2520 domain-containing protein [Bacteroidota bacterium]